MLLRDLARQTLDRLHAETVDETGMKQMKRGESAFHAGEPCFIPVKHDFPQKTANDNACFTVSLPRDRNNETEPLPAPIKDGLRRLKAMRPPRLNRPNMWPEIVADALRLASEGWAHHALALGWGPLQLWGCSPAAGGLVDLEGLAIWLSGRRVLLINERTCIAANITTSAHSIFTRRSTDGAVFLWDLSRGR